MSFYWWGAQNRSDGFLDLNTHKTRHTCHGFLDLDTHKTRHIGDGFLDLDTHKLKESRKRETRKGLERIAVATLQCSFLRSKENTTNYPKWHHHDCWSQGIKLFIRRSLIQNTKRPHDYVGFYYKYLGWLQNFKKITQ